MEIDYIEEQIRQLQDGVGLDSAGGDRLRALASADDLVLFIVDNLAGKRGYVLARNERFARILAHSAGHLRGLANGDCFVATDRDLAGRAGFASAVQRAIKDRRPGMIEPKGNHAIMGSMVYAPLTLVKK